jgi:transcriptional regulator with XRE-family HTH domain
MGNVGSSEPEVPDNLKTFGAGLKVLREAAGLTQERYAGEMGFSTHYVAKIEQGKRFPPREVTERAKEVLGELAERLLIEMEKSLTRRAALVQRFHHWAAIEEKAITLDTYECRVIPGLLQAEPYMRALFAQRLPPYSEDKIESMVTARLARHTIFDERPNTAFSFIIEQALLERHFGGKQVTRALFDNLLELSQRRHIEVQVMPLVMPDIAAGSGGPIYLAETPDHRWIGYTESQLSSTLITAPEHVSMLRQRYGKLRTHALDPAATVKLIEQMRGEL